MPAYRKHRKRFMTEINVVPYVDGDRVAHMVTCYKLLMKEFGAILQPQAFSGK